MPYNLKEFIKEYHYEIELVNGEYVIINLIYWDTIDRAEPKYHIGYRFINLIKTNVNISSSLSESQEFVPPQYIQNFAPEVQERFTLRKSLNGGSPNQTNDQLFFAVDPNGLIVSTQGPGDFTISCKQYDGTWKAPIYKHVLTGGETIV